MSPQQASSQSQPQQEGPLLIYLHGFLSSPQSYKCQLLQDWLQASRPDIEFCSPQISPHPGEAAQVLGKMLEDFRSQPERPIGLVGSSMGGFWSTWLAEQYQLPAVVVNPAVKPSRFMPKYLEQELHPYSVVEGQVAQTYRLTREDVDKMQQLENALPSALQGRYWLLTQRGDETLNSREAEAFYTGQRQTVEEGGDHAFQGFARYTQALVDFLFGTKQSR